MPDIPGLPGYSPNAEAPIGQTPTAPGTDIAQLRQSLVSLPMDEQVKGEWLKRCTECEEFVKLHEQRWDILLDEYMPIVSPTGHAETVKINAHFRNVHSKIGEMFVQSPEVTLTPKEASMEKVPLPSGALGSAEDAISVKQAVLNDFLTDQDGINASRLMGECLFDALAWAGIACVKVGYRAYFKTIQRPVMQQPMMPPMGAGAPPMPPAPMPPMMMGGAGGPQQPMGQLQPPGMPPMGMMPPPPPPQPVIDPLTGQPQMESVRVPIHEEWYASRFSPKKLLFNSDLRSTRFDKDATFMGMVFFMEPAQIEKTFGIPAADITGGSEDDRVHLYKDVNTRGTNTKVKCYEVVYKASHFTDEIHPLKMNQLILISGYTGGPAVHRPSPDQSFDDMGRITPDSLVGFPFLVLTTRDVADTPFPPSDAAFANSSAKTLNTFRRQGVKLRDAAIGKYLVDAGIFEEGDFDAFVNAEVGTPIKMKPGSMAQGVDKILAVTPQVHATADDYRTAQMLKQDMDEMLGISSAQAGAPLETVRSATEIAEFSSGATGRIQTERNRVIEFYLALVRKIDALIVRYISGDHLITVVGQDGARRLQMWNRKLIYGRCAYAIKPDSQLMKDVARDRQQQLQAYNLTAQDPLVNRVEILRNIFTLLGYDPLRAVFDPSRIPPQIPPVGGEVMGGNEVSKHQSERSGGMQNRPGGQGDNRDERTGKGPQTPVAGERGGARPVPGVQ